MTSVHKTADAKVLASLKTNGFVANPMSSIAIATVSGMALMFVTISIGAHIFISMLALFAGILLVYGFRVGKITYDLMEDGIRMRIRRFIPYYLKKKEEERFIVWTTIKSFKHDTDLTRNGQEYEFIKLYLKQSPGEVWITDQHDKTGFQTFRDAFREVVNAEKAKLASTMISATGATKEDQQTTHLVQKKSFYKTNFAKIITVFFILVLAGLITAQQFYGLSLTSLYRLEFVLIPGVMYMSYRVFVKQEDNK